MPRAKKTTKKDAEGELINHVNEVIEQKANNFWSCTAPIHITNNYIKKKKEGIPENPTNHWTKDKNDERWLYLWDIEQKINRIQFEFHKTANWESYRKINPLNKAKQLLLEEGVIITPETSEELHKTYYCNETKALKNYNNHYFQGAYYEKTEEGEIIEEVIPKGKRINYNGYKF